MAEGLDIALAVLLFYLQSKLKNGVLKPGEFGCNLKKQTKKV